MEESEDERIKREIWEEVNKTREERLKREEEERKARDAKAARTKRNPETTKPKPVIVDDSEASEKLLEQRRKHEEERKRLTQLRQQGRQNKPQPAVEIAVSSPKKDSMEIDIPIATSSRSSSRTTPAEVAAPVPATTTSASRQTPVAATRTPISSSQSFSHSQTSTSSHEEELQNWKDAYERLQKRFDAEQIGKKKVEQVLAQYENTINSLMMEQESAGDPALTENLRQQVNELKVDLETANAELLAVSKSNEALTTKYKEIKSQLELSLNNEKLLQAQNQKLQAQLQTRLDTGDSNQQLEAFTKYRAATARQIEVLKLRCAKSETKSESLQAQLASKTAENEQLTNISDTLLALLEKSEQ